MERVLDGFVSRVFRDGVLMQRFYVYENEHGQRVVVGFKVHGFRCGAWRLLYAINIRPK